MSAFFTSYCMHQPLSRVEAPPVARARPRPGYRLNGARAPQVQRGAHDVPRNFSPPSRLLPCRCDFPQGSVAIEGSEARKEAFETLALNELPVLYRVARRMMRAGSDAEDLVSQTLLLAAKGWAAFDGRFPRSWLIKIMRNEYLRILRTAGSRPQTVSFEDAPEPDDERAGWRDLDARLLSESIVEELDSIPEEYRLAVSLCDVEEMSYADAAKALEVPIGTVRSRLFRGRRMLRDRLAWEQQEGEHEKEIDG